MVKHERTLDLKKGVYRRHWRYRDKNGRVTSIHFLRFVSLADPHALIMRVSALPENYSAMMRLETGMSECEGCRTSLQPVAEKATASSACGPKPATVALTCPWRRGRGCIRGCLLYTSDAADDLLCVDLGGGRIIK